MGIRVGTLGAGILAAVIGLAALAFAGEPEAGRITEGNAISAESGFDQEIHLLVEMLGLAPGATVADIGAGEGEYAFAVAEIVGEAGRVLATELGSDKLTALEAAVEERGLSQVSIVKGEYEGTGLEPASVDAAFLRDVYHHITAPQEFMADLFQTIRPGGRLVLVDFPPTFWLALWTPKGIPENRGGHGIHVELLIEEASVVGFVPLRTVDPWPSSNFVTNTYAVAFERPSGPIEDPARVPPPE
ncbi:MAG: methyltransferase domain-containing protein [bacterium]|nr:methyltransferase domain-containing protein [bacterium]